MTRETPITCKALPTFFTWVRFLSRVCTDMALQVISTMFGRVWTMRALVYLSLISCMSSTHMIRETPTTCKALPTFFTWVRFLSSVSTDMLLQSPSTMFGRVWTMRALIYLSLISWMHCRHMSIIGWRLSKAPPTFFTWVRFLFSMGTDVREAVCCWDGEVPLADFDGELVAGKGDRGGASWSSIVYQLQGWSEWRGTVWCCWGWFRWSVCKYHFTAPCGMLGTLAGCGRVSCWGAVILSLL